MSTYKHPAMTPEKMADIAEDTAAIANIMGRYTFLTCYKRHSDQFARYWTAQDPTLTLDSARYEGYDAVKGYFVDYNNAQTRWANDVMRRLHPEELGGKSDEEIWGVGSNTVFNFTTPLIEIAYDGKTAKGIWYIMGSETEVYSKGPKANWNFGRCAVDFVKETDGWKIWHLRFCTDFRTPLSGNWGRDKVPDREGPAAPVPTKTGEFYKSWSPDYVALVEPALPEPYDTFENTFSY